MEGTCGAGKIVRKAYTRRRRGTVSRVRAARITDRGAKGKWASLHGPGIGKLKEGTLTKYGYLPTKSTQTRHRTLRKAVRAYGTLSTFRKLQALGTYTKRTSKVTSKRALSDRDWVKKTFMKV